MVSDVVKELIPAAKLAIMINGQPASKFFVQYNPNSYSLERSVKYSAQAGVNQNAPNAQFICGGCETLKMELFFDTTSSSITQAFKDVRVLVTSLAPSAVAADVRKYTSKVFNLMAVNAADHTPPLLKLEWSSLQFIGYLVSCAQRFTKFNEFGKPVRAVLNVEFIEKGDQSTWKPLESPDTTKVRTVVEGDALWSVAQNEYGQCAEWRRIAQANGVDNPRLLRPGSALCLPAIV